MMTPAFTGGLGALAPHMYPFGSALLGTIQQVAAAVGTAMAIAVLAWRQASLTVGGATAEEAMDGGVRAALLVGVLLGVVVVVISTFVRTRPGVQPAGEQEAPQEAGSADESELQSLPR